MSRMKFVDGPIQPETQVRVTLEQDGQQLDLKFNGHLVGFFADGELYLCSFGRANRDMYALENLGVLFETVGDGSNSYKIKVQ